MASIVEIDVDNVYKAWRNYIMRYTTTTHFGMVFDPTRQAEFPYANLRLLGRPKSGGDLEGDEASVTLTYETEAYINNERYTDLYKIDTASAKFFAELGFGRIGDSQPIKVSDTVTKITSRFTLANFCGSFLKELGSF